jgi:hypothetical protein
MAPVRRDILAAGAAVAVVTAAPQVLAESTGPDIPFKFYEKATSVFVIKTSAPAFLCSAPRAAG